MPTIAVIDYGMGNIRSVSKALDHVSGDASVIVSSDPERITHADHVVLPGVGALKDCISELQRLELDQAIRECVINKPFLGICLGMQALFEMSEENDYTQALGILPGKVKRFDENKLGKEFKVPHMGWNHVSQTGKHKLWRGIPDQSYFYFVHSYYVVPEVKEVTAGTTDYGSVFTSVIAEKNIFAVQFHPEKSQHVGLTLLSNFIRWDGSS